MGSEFHLQSPADSGLEQTAAWSTPPHNYKSVSLDVARENTNIFRYLFSQNIQERFHPFPVLSLVPVLGLRLLHRDIAFWKAEPIYGRSGRGGSGFPSNGIQVRAGPSLLILLVVGLWAQAGQPGPSPAAREMLEGQITHPLCCGKDSAACGWHLRLLLSHR